MNVQNLTNYYLYFGDYVILPGQTIPIPDIEYNKDDILAAIINSANTAGTISVTSPPSPFPREGVHGEEDSGQSANVPFISNTRIISPASPEFGSHMLHRITQAQVTLAWFAANDPIAVPFALGENATVKSLGWYTGSTPGDNADLGIYDLNLNRLVSTGSTAIAGVNVIQWVNVTDTLLTAGRYYAVMAVNSVTSGRVRFFNHSGLTSLTSLLGCLDSATDAFPLPATLTNMAAAATATRIPIFTIALKEPI